MFAALAALTMIAAASAADARDLGASFPAGSGSRFTLHSDAMGNVELVISVASSSKSRIAVEYMMASREGLPIEMWQQYVLDATGSGPPKLVEGYVFAKELEVPEKVTGEYLKGFDGLSTADFLFSDRKQLDKNKVGDETVTVPAGTVKATHYRQPGDGHVVDYWISDEAKPMGLVKLVSTGNKPQYAYELALESIVTNVKPKIDPARARPLSAKGKTLLATPGKK